MCGGKGHWAAECPNNDRCQLCGPRGDFARNCTNPWNNQGPRKVDPSVGNTSVDQTADAASVAPSAGASSQLPDAESTVPGDVVDSAVSGDSGSAGACSNGAGEESLSAVAVFLAADGVLNVLFASSSDDDDDDGSHVDITEFPSEVSQPPSQIISQFTGRSQSILRNVPSKSSDSSTLTKDNVNDNVGNGSSKITVGSKMTVVLQVKVLPILKLVHLVFLLSLSMMVMTVVS